MQKKVNFQKHLALTSNEYIDFQHYFQLKSSDIWNRP